MQHGSRERKNMALFPVTFVNQQMGQQFNFILPFSYRVCWVLQGRMNFPKESEQM